MGKQNSSSAFLIMALVGLVHLSQAVDHTEEKINANITPEQQAEEYTRFFIIVGGFLSVCCLQCLIPVCLEACVTFCIPAKKVNLVQAGNVEAGGGRPRNASAGGHSSSSSSNSSTP